MAKDDFNKALGKRSSETLNVPTTGLRLARLHRKKFTEAVQGRAMKRWDYLLARLVRSKLSDIKYPFLDMKCRAWELWIYPDGRLAVKIIDRPLAHVKLNFEYDLGYAPLK